MDELHPAVAARAKRLHLLCLAADAGPLSTGSGIWRAAPVGALRHVRLDSMTAIYDRRAAQTHVVAEIVPELLDAMGVNGADAATIAIRLGLNTVDDALIERLDELVASGLASAR